MLTLRWRPFGRSWGQFLTPDEQLDIQKEPSNLKTKTEASLCQEDDREILAAGLLSAPYSRGHAEQAALLLAPGEQTWEINAEGTTHAAFHPYATPYSKNKIMFDDESNSRLRILVE